MVQAHRLDHSHIWEAPAAKNGQYMQISRRCQTAANHIMDLQQCIANHSKLQDDEIFPLI